MADLVLSLFPGIGLLDMAFEEAGFCVVRGPDLLWGGDVKRFHPPAGRFDGVIGGPPCQVHSAGASLAKVTGGPEREDLIPEFCRVVSAARPRWFAMECAPKSPPPLLAEYAVWSGLLHNRDFGEEQVRCRRWSFGVRTGDRLPVNLFRFLETVALHVPGRERAVRAGGYYPGPVREVVCPGGRVRRFPMNSRATKASVAEALRLQGLPADFFEHSPLTIEGQQRVVGNGVPLAMGRAVASAIVRALAWLEEERTHGEGAEGGGTGSRGERSCGRRS